MKRAALAVALVLTAIEIGSACSEQVPLAPAGAKCELDDQCQQGLACRCVRRRNPDEEGPDEILEPGFCIRPADFKSCPRSDGGVADTAFDAPPAIDTAPEAAADTDAADAADGG